jgi:hypothetical protein
VLQARVVMRVRACARAGHDCVSSGDALREMYALQLIKSDFVLVTGDVISNMKLGLCWQT